MNKLVKILPFSLREFIRVLLFGKNHHQDLVKFLKTRKAKVMFDIGAEAGYEAILAAKAGMKVYAFEPDPNGLKALDANVKAEGISGEVTIVPKAASDFDGQAEFFFGRQSTLVPTENVPSTVVDVVKLSTFMQETGVRPDFMKIDAEGANLGVVKGYSFDLYKPMIISVEYESQETEIEAIFHEQGYKIVYAIYRPVNRQRRAIFWKYSQTPDFTDGAWGDLVAVQGEYFGSYKMSIGLS